MEINEKKWSKYALLSYVFQIVVSSIGPTISYFFAYQYQSSLWPHAWSIWAVVLFLGIFVRPCMKMKGITAIAASNTKLLVIHLVCEFLIVTTVASLSTSWFFTFNSACMLRQSSLIGCQSCPCAIDNSCTENDGSAPGCEVCEILSASACSAMRSSTSSAYIATAVTGFVILLASFPPICIELVILHHKMRDYISSCSNVQATRVFVDQQSRLVAAGDKPTCTPGTLAEWVADLDRSGHASCQKSAEKCRYILQQRGFDLNIYLGSRTSATQEKRLSSHTWLPHLSDDSMAQASIQDINQEHKQLHKHRDVTQICKRDLEDQS